MSEGYKPKRQAILFYDGDNWENYLDSMPKTSDLPEDTCVLPWDKNTKHYSLKNLYDKNNEQLVKATETIMNDLSQKVPSNILNPRNFFDLKTNIMYQANKLLGQVMMLLVGGVVISRIMWKF